MNQTARGKESNPIIISSSDDESDHSNANINDEDFDFFFENNEPQLPYLGEKMIPNNIQRGLNVPIFPNNEFPPPPLPPPPLPPPPPPQQFLPIHNAPPREQRFDIANGIRNFFHQYFSNKQPQQQNEMMQAQNIRNNRQIRNFQRFLPAINPPPPPPQLDSMKRKNIKLNGIDLTIIDVPHKILAALKKGCEVSSSFDMAKASTYIQMVLQHGEIPDDFLDRLVVAACDPKTSSAKTYYSSNELVLRNFLPEYRINDIRSAFKKNKYLLLNTYNFVKQGTAYTKINRPRNPESKLTIDDAIVSVQLDELFDNFEKERKKKEKEEEEENQIRQAELDGSLIECECCICEYPFDWMIQCPEGHLMCKRCVERQIETAISEGRSNVPCLKFGGCDQKISMKELQRLIPKKTLERLVATETLNAITTAEIENMVTCHKCGYIVIYDANGPMNCPQCKAQTCPKCGGAWHPNMTCQQFKEIDKDRLVEEQMNEAVVRTCPKCKTQFMKDEGCNKMECPRCHTWICYWCRKVIPKEVGYEHFWRQPGPCPPDKCPLWVQNDTLHLIEAEKAKDNAKGDLKDGNLNLSQKENE